MKRTLTHDTTRRTRDVADRIHVLRSQLVSGRATSN